MASIKIQIKPTAEMKINPPEWDQYNASESVVSVGVGLEQTEKGIREYGHISPSMPDIMEMIAESGILTPEYITKVNSFEPTFEEEHNPNHMYQSLEPQLRDFIMNGRVDGKSFLQLGWEKALCRCRIAQALTTKNTDYSGHKLSRRQSTITGCNCLGIFAETDFKRGEIITQYGIHIIFFKNGYGKVRVEYDTSVFNQKVFVGEDENTINPDFISLIADGRAGDYGSSVRTSGESKDIDVSIIGFPEPELNKDERFWGHLINDKAYRGTEKYLKTLNNCSLGMAGQDCEGLWEGSDFTDKMDDPIELLSRFNDRVSIIATKDIKKGEELGTSYGKPYWFGDSNGIGSRHTCIKEGRSVHTAPSIMAEFF